MLNIIQKYTPNFGKRNGYKPEIIVIHIMAGTLQGTDSWFADPASGVSSHYGIGFHGEVHQYVKEEDRAWHAGTVSKPSFKLYKEGVNPNEYSIGIEHEGNDLSIAPISQLEASASLIRDICTRWAIPVDREHIIGHYQIRSTKPSCPATDKSVIDKLIAMVKPEELVSIQVPKSKVDKLLAYLKTI